MLTVIGADELLSAEEHWNVIIIFKYYDMFSSEEKDTAMQARLLSTVRKIFLHTDNIPNILKEVSPKIIENLRLLLQFVLDHEYDNTTQQDFYTSDTKITTKTAIKSSNTICSVINYVLEITQKTIIDLDLDSPTLYDDFLELPETFPINENVKLCMTFITNLFNTYDYSSRPATKFLNLIKNLNLKNNLMMDLVDELYTLERNYYDMKSLITDNGIIYIDELIETLDKNINQDIINLKDDIHNPDFIIAINDTLRTVIMAK